jgi:hypothetical protein
MLTIKNYHKLQNKNFMAKSGQPGWIVSHIVEKETEYQIVVMPWDGMAYSIQHAIVYRLERKVNEHGHYNMHSSKNDRIPMVWKSNLTLDNFILELGIQTGLNTN